MHARTDIRRYHPALPTVDEANASAILPFLSDHVPIVCQIPLGVKNQTITMLSWNVLEDDVFNGFSKPGAAGARWGESDQQREDRHLIIAQRLKLFLDHHDVDFITLQEIKAAKGSLFESIMTYLPKKYRPGMMFTVDNGIPKEGIANFHGCITLYNTETILKKPGLSTADLFNHEELHGCVTHFNHGETLKEIKLLNVHTPFSENPKAHETHIKHFLTEKNRDTLAIVVGDFNCTVAPTYSTRKNITTSVASTNFRYEPNDPIATRLPQSAYAIDGAFYSTSGSLTCHQAEIKHVNMDDWAPYQDTELQPFESDIHENEGQLREINQPRLAIMIDACYQSEKLCGALSLPEYEDALQQLDQTIVVRITKTLNNDTGIAIGNLSLEIIKQLNEKNHDNKLTFCRAVVNDLGHEPPMRYVSVSLADFSTLHSYLSTFYPTLNDACNEVLTKNRLDAFSKIYKALRDGQASLFKKNFLLFIESMADKTAEESIEANIKRNPHSRTAVAWKLADTYRTCCHDNNQELLKAIYLACFDRSAFSKSSLSGISLWKSSEVHNALNEKDITLEDRSHGSRSGKIATALGPQRK